MSGFRKQEFYIKKYGPVEGPRIYNELLKRRENRLKRRNASSDNKIECKLCGKYFKRITRTHLKNKCIESITTEEYLSRFPNAELITPSLRQLYSNTEESIKDKWGDSIGKEKWKQYVSIQAESNSFNYKSSKYKWSEKQFEEYNKQRASTLDNFINRYGEELGFIKWEEYCDRQRYTTSITYFIKKYGTDQGLEKYDNFIKKRIQAKKNQSSIELTVFEDLKDILNNFNLSISLDNPYYGPFDYGNLERKKLVEFYGTYWHADPRFFDKNHLCKQKNMTAEQIRSRDQAKRSYATNQGYQVFIIWEHDWYKNKEQIIESIKRWWNE